MTENPALFRYKNFEYPIKTEHGYGYSIENVKTQEDADEVISVHDELIEQYEEDIRELISEDEDLEKQLEQIIRRRKMIQIEIVGNRDFINNLKNMNKTLEEKI